MKALVWKEWRENRPWFFAFLAWMLFAAVYSIGYEWGWQLHASIGGFYGWMSAYTTLAAILLAMRVSQGEQTAGTLGFTTALPASTVQIASVRIAGAMLTLAVPLVVGALMMTMAFSAGWLEQAEPRTVDFHTRLPERPVAPLPVALEQLASVTAISALGGVQFLLVLSWLGGRLRNQAQVGLLGAVMAVGLLIASSLLWEGYRVASWQLAYGAVLPSSLAISWSYGTEQGGSYIDHELARHRWWAMGIALPVLFMFAYLFVSQYGRVRRVKEASGLKRRWPSLPTVWSHVPIRLPNPRAAMIWLELRQSLPLAFFGLLFALLVALLSEISSAMEPGGQFGEHARAELAHTMAFLGILWGAVVGTGIYSSDLGNKLGEFWRSRPISPRGWFWSKYISGLIAVLLVLDGATVLISWNAPHGMMEMSWAYVACFPLIHVLVYTLAVLGTCWLRKPVIGGFIAIFAFGILLTLLATFPQSPPIEPIDIYNQLYSNEKRSGLDLTRDNYIPVYGAFVAATAIMAWGASRLAAPLEPVWRWRASGA